MTNKKKVIVSVIFSAFMLNLQATAYAEEFENPDLQALASSLGADTDFLNIPNYYHDEERPVPDECYFNWLSKTTNTEFADYPQEKFNSVVNSGNCVGISLVEILCHNGIISPLDIAENAKKLSDIEYSADVNKLLTEYQALQLYTEYALYDHYIITRDYEEQVKNVVSTAEKCMNEGKYFLLYFQTHSMSHAVTGIGIASGNWTFNEKTYDKCILTHDSNGTDSNGNTGFNEKGCIYINSQTNQIFIPAYNIDSDDEMIIGTINNDTLLNYKGSINASYEPNVPQIHELTLKMPFVINYDITFFDENGTELPDGDYLEGDLGSEIYYTTGKKITSKATNVSNGDLSISNIIKIRDSDVLLNINAKNNPSEIIYEDNLWQIHSMNDEKVSWSFKFFLNDNKFPFYPHYCWMISGDDMNNVEVEKKSNGFLIRKDHEDKKIVVSVSDMDYDERGERQEPLANQFLYEFNASNNVLFAYDENNAVKLYIDKDEDNMFDDKVENGDINCDGIINASDASDIMKKYAEISTKTNIFSQLSLTTDKIQYNYMNYDFNNDGSVNAADASSVLAEYAKSATK